MAFEIHNDACKALWNLDSCVNQYFSIYQFPQGLN